VQLGKPSSNIKKQIGPDLQALTEANVFRFPSTFTFIFRAFASIDGIGKGLDTDFDIGQLSQPFVEELTDQARYGDVIEAKVDPTTKLLTQFGSLTGLNEKDINTAVTSPRKIQYLEETVRAMEQGSLKIRVRSLENEKVLERLAITQAQTTSLLVASVFLNLGLAVTNPVPTALCYVAAGGMGLKALGGVTKLKIFDKKARQFENPDFGDE